jgi:16S rRNA processing protein RimM
MLVMARVAGAFAVKGWVKLQVFTERVDSLLEYRTWWLQREGHWEPVEVEEGSAQGRALLAKLKGCDDREAAAALCGCDVAVPRDCLPPAAQGEYYWADLEGLRVGNLRGEPLGVVAGLLETGANQVLVVRGERERLIPFVGAVVKTVDVARGEVVVDWEADF